MGTTKMVMTEEEEEVEEEIEEEAEETIIILKMTEILEVKVGAILIIIQVGETLMTINKNPQDGVIPNLPNKNLEAEEHGVNLVEMAGVIQNLAKNLIIIRVGETLVTINKNPQ